MSDAQIDTIKQLARQNYGYELTSEAAAYVAALAHTIRTGARAISSLDLSEVEPPFGFTTLMEEAARIGDAERARAIAGRGHWRR
jgi:hypothetical protein